MALGNLQNEADLKRFVEDQMRTPGVVPPTSLPFKNMKCGFGELTWPGETPQSNLATVAHGLGDEPKAIFITPVVPSVGDWWAPLVTTSDDTQFEFNARTFIVSPEAEANGGYYWLAVC